MGSSAKFSIDFGYANDSGMSNPTPQIEKFKRAARDLETDDDPKRFKERLAKVVKHKPVPDKAK